MLTVKFAKLDPLAQLPKQSRPGDAGLDLFALEDVKLDGPSNTVRTGIACEIPGDYFGLVRDRSSRAMDGLRVAAGVIDANYRGEILVVLDSLVPGPYFVHAGEKIAQLLVLRYARVNSVEVSSPDQLTPTERGERGFGSSGK